MVHCSAFIRAAPKALGYCVLLLALSHCQAGRIQASGVQSDLAQGPSNANDPLGNGNAVLGNNNDVAQNLPPDANAVPSPANGGGEPNTPRPAPVVDKSDNGSHTVGPDYKDDPAMHAIAGVPQGTWCHFSMNGTQSKYFTGNSPLLNRSYAPVNRNVSVYLPPGYVAGTQAPLLVLQDNQWNKAYLDHVLDNLIATKKIPPLVAVSIDNGGGDSTGSERGYEYDVVSGDYAMFVETEVLPLATQHCKAAFTTQANGRAIMGTSSGGAAAFGAAYWHPELFQKVLTYSTSLTQIFPTDDYPDGSWSYPNALFAKSAHTELRIFFSVCDNDLNAGANNKSDWVAANQKMQQVLEKKGFNYQFYYARNAVHVDGKLINQTLPGALAWLWRDYQP
jgi:enterochelin esterase family protein